MDMNQAAEEKRQIFHPLARQSVHIMACQHNISPALDASLAIIEINPNISTKKTITLPLSI
jgi:hypothetical protein